MKIILEHEGIKLSIEAPAVTLDEVLETVMKPALLALGFQPESVDKITYNNV